jgi:alkylhydroperoxidase/carboxymuconolactone decarboxylase family protein YurZ
MLTDAAIGMGATPEEIVEVLVAIVPTVGLPRAVLAAPSVAMALGYDLADALE